MDLATFQLAASVALNLAMAVVMGASLSGMALRQAGSAWAAQHAAGLRSAALGATGAAIAASCLLLWLDAAYMAEVPLAEAGPAVITTLSATHHGFAWSIGIASLAAIALASAALAWPRAGTVAAWARLLAIGAFLYSRSIVGHAGAGDGTGWAVAAEWTHLALASAWVGEVLVAGLLVLRTPASPAPGAMPDRAAYIQGLSTIASIALAGIVATGVFSAWRGLGGIENATGNPYATALLAKLALVACAALLGGANRFLVMPGLLAGLRGHDDRAGRLDRRFAWILQLEALVLAAVLVMAAILSSTSPPTAA
ncbi:CopD family protein [Pseudoduganella sp. GCM10020061]|uniref:CopD family protein n=1 Tax=Pseudoduganella sp. GCM10020061 TaxID=3317345 RepID=UPI00363F5539